MAKHDRQQRRTKRMAKHKKRRANSSRPSRDPSNVQAGPPPSTRGAVSWPLGDCMMSLGYDEPGAELTAVVTRVHGDGRAIAAFVELDRAQAGITDIRIKGYASLDHVYGECGALSERNDQTIVGAPAGLVVGLIVDAHEHGDARPQGWDKLAELIEDVEPLEADPPFGPGEKKKQPQGGWLDRLFRWLG